MRDSRLAKWGGKFEGNISDVIALEDSIRATRKYTKGAFSKRAQHPIQGEDFPSKVIQEYYEVYPNTEVHWDMPAGVALDWLWGEVLCVDVTFKYDYRANKASVIIGDSQKAVNELTRSIPGFGDALERITANGNGKK